ncbi:hypothetical protein [Pseudoramibacter sp.]|jgi:ribosomal protein L37AE/L43A|uniref:hypothetical protein n=1 Tax=Pseudoramibacter sp. TaxID=2034862 RepID=UPI0025D90694|nr:hypothetical protein [Pseudoramibacter sp.]MCH4072998.1 hypothetical protein [Pseudoramibacter sp.]MCH4106769.1 hypothetical protein [Pseudoramibacter sp.]
MSSDAPKPILKFKIIQDGPDEFVDMEVKDFQFKKGGTGICPKCGGETKAVGHDWTCEKCGLRLNGPIF